jgi:hypothetical protein
MEMRGQGEARIFRVLARLLCGGVGCAAHTARALWGGSARAGTVALS